MDLRFAADEWTTLSVVERIRRCHLMAAELRTFAHTDSTSAREHYIQLAEQWLDLAADIQRDFIKGDAETGRAELPLEAPGKLV